MSSSNNSLCLDKFYPEKNLRITNIIQQKDKILIRMRSKLNIMVRQSRQSGVEWNIHGESGYRDDLQ